MLNNMLFILFLVSYAALFFALIKGKNATLVLLATGIFWAILGGTGGIDILNVFIGENIAGKGGALMTILFGSWFAQVLVHTGVVKTIIRAAVELGGDKPKVVVGVIMIVVSLLFTSLFSIGPVIAVGVIVLPVLISLGIKPRIAVVAFGLPVGISTMLNVSQYAVLRGIVPGGDNIPTAFGTPWTPYAFIVFGVAMTISIIGVLLTMSLSDKKKRRGKVKSWASKIKVYDHDEIDFVPWYVCIATFIPVVLVIAFKINIFSSFIIGAIYAIATAKTVYRGVRMFPTISKTFKNGISESSGMVMYMICTYVLISGASAIRPILQESVGNILPTTTLGISILIALGVPLLMYRGPLAIGGAGAALFATLGAIGAIPPQFLWMIAFTVSGIHYGVDPTNSSNIWACAYAKVKPKDFIKTSLPISWAFGAAIVAILYFMHG